MIAETISLGILSLPKAMATVGFVPGVVLILLLGTVSWYTGYVVYQFKQRHQDMHNYADAGRIIAGTPGYWIGWIMSVLILIFICAAHILTFSVAFNILTNHGACTMVYMVVGAVVCAIATIPRTLKATSYISMFCKCLSLTLNQPGTSADVLVCSQ